MSTKTTAKHSKANPSYSYEKYRRDLGKYRSLSGDDAYIYLVIKQMKSIPLRRRTAHQLYTYSKRAKVNKILYLTCLGVCLILPILAAVIQMGEGIGFRIVSILLMGCVTACAGAVNGFRFREKWEHYRKYCEKAKRELSMFENRLGEYKTADEPEELFADNLEKLVKREVSDWGSVSAAQPKDILQTRTAAPARRVKPRNPAVFDNIERLR